MSLDSAVLLQYALKVILAVAVFLIGRWLAGRVRKSLSVTLAKSKIAPSMTRLILLAAFYSIMLITVVVALALIGFPIEVLLTGSLLIVVILGFAMQQSISNLASAIIFMLFDPFHVGELVNTNGVTGDVKEIQFFSTVLVTGDNKEVTIPNAKIQNENLTNYTRLGRLRVDFIFSVGYDDDLEQAKKLLSEILAADERVLAEPATAVFVQSLDESAIRIAARPWVKSDNYWTLQNDIPERVKRCFDEQGISIPFPQRDVHVYGRASDVTGQELDTRADRSGRQN